MPHVLVGLVVDKLTFILLRAMFTKRHDLVRVRVRVRVGVRVRVQVKVRVRGKG